MIQSKLVNNIAEAKQDYNNYRNDGKEGSILKNRNFKWKDSRVADQVKLKNKTPIELRIIDIYAHTKEDHKVGGFVVEDLCRNGSNEYRIWVN
ncbi:DNA ligase [Klebsiella phage CPRSA]|nr:DNA ligase [Klebsiella phage CPRSA]